MVGYILLSLLALLLVLLLIPVRAELSWDKQLTYRVRYLWLQLASSESKQKSSDTESKTQTAPSVPAEQQNKDFVFDSEAPYDGGDCFSGTGETPERAPDSAEKESSAEPEKLAQQEAPEVPPTSKGVFERLKPDNLAETIALIQQVFGAASRPLRLVFRRIQIRKLRIEAVAGGEDAAKAAITFGYLNAVVYPLVAWLDQAFRLKVQSLSVRVDYDRTELLWRASCEVRLSPLTALCAAVGFLIRFFLQRCRAKRQDNPAGVSGQATESNG